MWFPCLVLALAAAPERLVTVGGGITETVWALGHGERVVAVDTSSVFPAAARALPQVGYQRSLSAEGVLAQRPDLVLLTAEAGPPAAVALLKQSGVRVVVIEETPSVAGARDKIAAVAAALGTPERAAPLLQRLDDDLAAIASVVADNRRRRPRVLFLYGRGGGAMQVAGTDTGPAAFIALAGGENAVDAFTGFRPLTAEGALLARPDLILLPARGLAAAGGVDAVLALPGLKDTPAGRARRVVGIDDLLLLGFSPRLGEGVTLLARALAEPASSSSSPASSSTTLPRAAP
jgi:iron complex transport system substrate-binding protein